MISTKRSIRSESKWGANSSCAATQTIAQMRKEIAALRDFSPLNVRFGPVATDGYITGGRGMSASPRKRASFEFTPAASSLRMPPLRPREQSGLDLTQ
jgi:hypothetical protein